MKNLFEFEDVVLDTDNITNVILKTKPAEVCPACGSENLTNGNSFEQCFEETSPDGDRERITVTGHRIRCIDCGKLFTPFERGLSSKYSEAQIEKMAKEYIIEADSIESLSKKYGIKPGMQRTLIRNYFRKRDESKQFEFPSYLGVEVVKSKNRRTAALFDVKDLSLLDILPLENLEIPENVKEVIITDEETLKALGEAIPKEKIVFLGGSIFDGGVEALIKDVRVIDPCIDLEGLFKSQNIGELKKAVSVSSRLFPVLLAYTFFLQNLNDVEKLKRFSTPLKNFGTFLENLSGGKTVSALPSDLISEYLTRSRSVTDLLKAPNTRKLSKELIRGGILYLDNNRKSVVTDDGSLVVGFKKRLEKT